MFNNFNNLTKIISILGNLIKILNIIRSHLGLILWKILEIIWNFLSKKKFRKMTIGKICLLSLPTLIHLGKGNIKLWNLLELIFIILIPMIHIVCMGLMRILLCLVWHFHLKIYVLLENNLYLLDKKLKFKILENKKLLIFKWYLSQSWDNTSRYSILN